MCRLKMGWKTINGRRCFYKSERDGGRGRSLVVTILDAIAGIP
jgi:hypothetical protein